MVNSWAESEVQTVAGQAESVMLRVVRKVRCVFINWHWRGWHRGISVATGCGGKGRAIFVLELILVSVFILFWVNNFYFYIVLVQPKSIFLVFISFSCNNFSFYTIIVRPLHRMLHTEKYALRKHVMMAHLQNPLQQEPTSCKQSCIICLDVLFLLISS